MRYFISSTAQLVVRSRKFTVDNIIYRYIIWDTNGWATGPAGIKVQVFPNGIQQSEFFCWAVPTTEINHLIIPTIQRGVFLYPQRLSRKKQFGLSVPYIQLIL